MHSPSPAARRDPETPINVVGASIIGRDTVDHGLWVAFWFFLAQLNFVLGAVNLSRCCRSTVGTSPSPVPRRSATCSRVPWTGRRRTGELRPLMPPPTSYVVLVVVGGYMLLTVTANTGQPDSDLFQ